MCAVLSPAGVTAPTGFGATGFASTQVPVAQRKKKGCPHPGPCLYYYDYVFIKTLKEEDRRTTGKPQRRPMRYAGVGAGDGKDRKPPALAARCGGLRGQGPSKAVRQPTTRWMTSTAGGWRCNGAVARKAPWRGWRSWASGAHGPRRQKLWARRENRHRVPTTRSALQGLREEGFEVCHRQRFAEQVALVQVATGLAQRNALLFGFHPFGDHVQPQAAREPDDGVQRWRRRSGSESTSRTKLWSILSWSSGMRLR